MSRPASPYLSRTIPAIILRPLRAGLAVCFFPVLPATAGPPVPAEQLTELQNAFANHTREASDARKRLALKRMIRDAAAVLERHPEASNRFDLLVLVFQAQRNLIALDSSPRNREALLETSRKLIRAPDSLAEPRLDAELLLTQTELARQGAEAQTRIKALRPMIARYRDTRAEAKMLRIALVMALELGDNLFIRELRKTMSERFAGDLEMISFRRDKLGGQVFGAPFCGTFKRSDGTTAHYPSDGLGQTTGIYFWSRENGGLEDLKRLAEVWYDQKAEVSGRLNLVSLNVDELPDAGEKILRDLGLSWPALHLPGGKNNPHYRAFARQTPALLTLSPTGYGALMMSGATRKSSGTTPAFRDYSRWVQSSLARSWTRPRYVNQVASLLAGDFLITDPFTTLFSSTLPPEMKGQFPGNFTGKRPKLIRTPDSVPEETLAAIQSCFVPPPLRYRLTPAEIKDNYLRAEKLCATAIAAHPEAPDLWIVRNRRIIAQMGLWKVTAKAAHFQRAVGSAREVLESALPPGAGLIARFCLARQALRDPASSPDAVISKFVASHSKEPSPGPILAVAALLALDAGHRELHEHYRARILENHLNDPMMWTYGTFLLNRYHRYQLFRAPFVSGRSFGRRQDYFLAMGTPEEARRTVGGSFTTIEGGTHNLNAKNDGKWTALLIDGRPVTNKRAPLFRHLNPSLKYAESRPQKDLKVCVLLTTDEIEATRDHLRETPLPCPTLLTSGGPNAPLLRRLGILAEDETSNLVILRPDGSIFRVISGLSMQTKAGGRALQNGLEWHDEHKIIEALEVGKFAEAKEMVMALAPPDKPGEDDPKKRKTKHSLTHLRSRARVYLAIGDLDLALKDATELVKRKTLEDADMSFRTDELGECEALLEKIRAKARK